VTIDWPALHRVTGSDWRPGRIPLPTYPFERQECWLEADPLVTGGRAGPGLDTNDPAGDPAALPALPEERWINVPVWRQTAPRPAEVTDGQTWLVLADEGTAGPLAARLSAGLAAAGGRVTLARPGGRYADGPDGFALRPGSAEDATAALRELAARGLAPQRVLHLWTLEPDAKSDAKPGADPDAATARCLQRGLHTLIALARATGDLGLGPWSLDVVTAGSQRVLPGDPVRPELATVVGPCRLMPVEYPRVRTRLVDIDATTEHRELLAELRAEPAEPVVALRGGRRWVPAYEVLDAACIAEDRPAARPRRGGAYLVTGGLGGVGLAMAERLARDHRARLVLMGRTRVPPREEWGRILASGATAGEVRRRLEGLLRLEAAGAQVVTVHGDVSRVEDVRAAVAAALDRFGGLHGVLHCAGVPASGLMQFKTAADIEKVLAPKVGGALALARVLREVPDPVDFVALFSSTASVTGGGAGQVDYCAANAFLDAFALSDPIPGCAVTSVGWGSWCWDGWSTGLDGRDEGARQSLRHHRETFGIGFEQGWQALQRALAAGEPHVVVSTQDFPALVSTGRRAATRPARDAPGRRPRPDLPTALVEPQTDTELAIAAVWAAALGLDQVGVHDDFVDLGGNSLIGMEIIAEVRRVLDLSHLPPRLLHQAPTVAALAKAAEAERAPADAPPDGPADGARDQRQTRIEQRRQMLRRGK
jgi:acyl transferase domain-containing protein